MTTRLASAASSRSFNHLLLRLIAAR
jgi:hypothetical protein